MSTLTRLTLSVVVGWVAATPGYAAEQRTLQPPDAACSACHGAGGNRPGSPATPRLAGQYYDYLVQALDQYRDGARQDPIMGAMAKSLSDAQIRALARYFSSQAGLTEKY